VDKKRAKSGRESEGISCHKPRGHKNKYLTAHKASDPIESILRKNFAAIVQQFVKEFFKLIIPVIIPSSSIPYIYRLVRAEVGLLRLYRI